MQVAAPRSVITAVCGVQKRVRDPRAGYFQSLDVLKAAKACGVYTKSSIMLGLGETHDEVIDTMYDLKDAVRTVYCSTLCNTVSMSGCCTILSRSPCKQHLSTVHE